MSEIVGSPIEQAIDEEFEAFSEVLDETDGLSVYDFIDADTMADPSLVTTCERLLKYADSVGSDSLFGAQIGIHFAVTMSELAGFQTDRALGIVSELLADYERLDYTEAYRAINQSADSYYESNPEIDGFTQAYLLTDIQESYSEGSTAIEMDPVKLASRLGAAMMFMAIEEQVAGDDIISRAEDLLRV